MVMVKGDEENRKERAVRGDEGSGENILLWSFWISLHIQFKPVDYLPILVKFLLAHTHRREFIFQEAQLFLFAAQDLTKFVWKRTMRINSRNFSSSCADFYSFHCHHTF